MEKICVIGIGNILLLDEGVGPAVVKKLIDEYEFPDNVEVMDCGCMGLALLPEFEENDLLVVIDAVDNTGMPAGTVFRYAPEDIASNVVMHSAHDMRFTDVRDAASMLGYSVEGICIGIQIENMSPSEYAIGLTSDVEASLGLACETVLSVLVDHGVDSIVEKATGKRIERP